MGEGGVLLYNEANRLMKKKSGMIIGIDEVGRGCLAGPVTVCAVSVSEKFIIPGSLPELRDSKKMTRAQREAWCKWIRKNGKEAGICYAVSSVSPKLIDRLNISQAANLAAWRSYGKLIRPMESDQLTKVILDGGLFLKNRLFQEGMADISVKTVIKADATFLEVKMASVVAKVTRDAMMRKMGAKLPGYGFEVHKGYGTKAHKEAIEKGGRIDGIHRNSFMGNKNP